MGIEMKHEDIDFLVNLQHELNTQSHDGNAQPLWWGVMEDREIAGFEDGWATNYSLCKEGDPDFEIKGPTVEDIKRIGVEECGMDEEDFEYCVDTEDALRELNIYSDEYYLVGVQTLGHLNRGCLFLTKKECKEYITRYGYNHKNPRTYAMTAYRCETYARLLNIIRNTNWQALKGGKDETVV